jgi:hypothetical protein
MTWVNKKVDKWGEFYGVGSSFCLNEDRFCGKKTTINKLL